MSVLSKIIDVDKEKCVNCHACIGVCPVKYCNDGSGDHVIVNQDLCIGCGSCLTACTHEARKGVDDFSLFLEALQKGEKLIAIMAPAAAANFPEKYHHLIGWLHNIGVSAVFDVSFGAELTIKSYYEYVKKARPQTVISQPCPAIVTYIEIYQPELLPYLAPADSPMLHTLKMVKEYYPEYSAYKTAVISPCFAKRREFDETGMGDYNLTYISIDEYLKENTINLLTYPKEDFANRAAERAALFSTPGGLMRTMERESEEVAKATRKIEGPEIMYEYLKDLPQVIQEGKAPLVVDCLNCEKGCNGGTGTLSKEKAIDEIEWLVEERSNEMIRKYKRGLMARLFPRWKVRRAVNRYWKPGLYDRHYRDLSSTYGIKTPNKEELTRVYDRLKKEKPEDHLNCGACGYGSCEGMAIAIFNGLNKEENCFHYERHNRHDLASSLSRRLKESTGILSQFVNTLSEGAAEGNGSETLSIQGIAEIAEKTEDFVNSGVDNIEQSLGKMSDIQETSVDTIGGIKNLGDQIKSIWDILGIINSVASQTKIIAFNAELEASAAGEKGKNFEIVASEIRRLADNTVLSTQEIKEKINEIQRASNNLILAGEEEAERITEGWELSKKIQEIFSDLHSFTETSNARIQKSTDRQIEFFHSVLKDLRDLSEEIDTFNA